MNLHNSGTYRYNLEVKGACQLTIPINFFSVTINHKKNIWKSNKNKKRVCSWVFLEWCKFGKFVNPIKTCASSITYL